MFSRKRNYESCIQKVKIEVGTLVGLEKDDEAFITLSELPTLEMIKFKDASEKGESEVLLLFKEVLPNIIVDHNFYEDDEGKKKMDNTSITDLIFASLELTSKVIKSYTEASFFTQRKQTEKSLLPSAETSLVAEE